MTKAIFTIKSGSGYDDQRESHYHFPRTYLNQVEAAQGDSIIYYEPRRSEAGIGRKAYFATARVESIKADPTVPSLTVAPLLSSAPSLTLPRERERGQAEQMAPAMLDKTTEQPDLTAQARALYEDSAVPVREIARLAGVSERTLYKYVIKHDWKRRYKCVARDVAVAAANRGRRWQRAEGFVTAKGAGGRFIRREDAGKPFATGLKATDAAGRARAEAACAAAALRARDAATKAELRRLREAQIRAIEDANRAIAAWRTFHGEVAGQEEARAVRKSTKARKDEPARQARRTSRWRSWQQPSGAACTASADEPWKHRTRPPAERAKPRGLSPQQQALDEAYMMTVEASLRSWRFLLERERALQGLESPLAGSAPETPPK